MSLRVQRHAEVAPAQLAELEAAMTAFYRNPPPRYHEISAEAARHYNTREQPFHCDLIGRVVPGASVVELGCGTGHLCAHVEARGGRYTGVDHGESLLEQNKLRFPQARFLRAGAPLNETFDIVASLYTIEHVVDPPAYLEQMWRLCRPGGLLAVICPEFVAGPDLPPSFFYGRTPRRFREKLKTMDLADAAQHWWDLKVRGTRWKQRAQSGPPGAFWINLRPRVLHGAEYGIDADAVHLAHVRDLVWFFEKKGAQIVQTSAGMNGVAAQVLRYNGYVLARKVAA